MLFLDFTESASNTSSDLPNNDIGSTPDNFNVVDLVLVWFNVFKGGDKFMHIEMTPELC